VCHASRHQTSGKHVFITFTMLRFNFKVILHIIGVLLLFNGGLMLLSALVSWLMKDGVTFEIVLSAFIVMITGGFGVRNFENLDQGLSEILRVLRPGGDLVILETAVPKNILIRKFYYLYTRFIMPSLGKLFSKDRSAYRYLSDSAAAFPFGKAFNNILAKNGFIEIEDIPQTLGVASIYRAKKPTF